MKTIGLVFEAGAPVEVDKAEVEAAEAGAPVEVDKASKTGNT
jgi:hypothetical protein